MPEGDTLFRVAATLAPLLVGREVTRFEAGTSPTAPTLSPTLAPAVLARAPVVGHTIRTVEPRGKNLLIVLDDERTLHTHLRMSGSWHLYHPGDRWKIPAKYMRVVIGVEGAVAVCFHAPVVRLLTKHALDRDPQLTKLGPDVLADDFDPVAARGRLRQRDARSLGEAILVQSAIAGLGNVYKSEILYILRLDPFAKVALFTNDELDALIAEGHRLMHMNIAATRVQGAPDAVFRSAPDPFAIRRRTTRTGAGSERLWVYGRSGLPCFTCGEPIAMKRQGDLGRSTYYCKRCQVARVGG